ncbi:MAG: DNA adenine methylase [Pleurocapsa sp. SU_5_0]|nr:DNA adenine methylase [Pleurocapsa sp. SU_5_0]NJR47767.1 DNA adenine methylase [Hyellaceae cyanobacterium CSU_1_1]
MVSSDKLLRPKPFVKWAGGKTQLLPYLLERMPRKYDRYFEPFIGGGALFFKVTPRQGYISDINPELINAYQVIQLDVESLIEDLKKHIYDKNYYYKLRNVDRTPEFKNWSPVKKASRIIALNKSCFNGLYRVNSKGHFNVPFGRYKNPKLVDAVNLRECSKALKDTKIVLGSFNLIEQDVQKGDFVYFDPPYVPLNITSSFTSYSKEGFNNKMQENLRDICVALDCRQVKFMLSNSSTPLILELYKDFNLSFVDASRAINSRGDKRGKVKEVIVTNY